MTEIERIHDQLRRAFHGEAWHGPSLREALDGVTAEQAAARPVPGAHTVGEIVLHLAAWLGVMPRRLAGEAAREPEEGDWPSAEGLGEAEWRALLGKLEERHAALLDAVSRVDPARLDEPIFPGWTSVSMNLHGTAEHLAYHAGQVALLRRAAEAG